MEITTKEFKHCHLVSISGRVDSSTASQFSRSLEDLNGKGIYKLVIDMKAWIICRVQASVLYCPPSETASDITAAKSFWHPSLIAFTKLLSWLVLQNFLRHSRNRLKQSAVFNHFSLKINYWNGGRPCQARGGF